MDTGGLTGTVADTTGARIVGATITLTNNATNVSTVTKTTSSGVYAFNEVRVGTYTLRATGAGFKEYTTPDITIYVQQIATVNITLQPGAASQQVVVTAATPLLQVETASVSQTVQTQEVNDMPLNGRDWVSLGQIAAGVATTAGGNSSNASFTVNGNSDNQNEILLNGIDDVEEQYGNNSSITPPPDAIQEFTLQTGDFSAEFGHSTGGIINATIKSGGNSLHGDLWEYVRNNDFDANSFFSNLHGTPISEYRENQFGGTGGGPVLLPKIYDGRNRTFWFFDYQGTRIISPVAHTSTVPTALEASSGFTNLQDINTYNTGTLTDALGRIFPIGTVFDPATTRTVAAEAIDPVSGFTNTSANAIFVRDPFFTGSSISGIQNFTPYASELNMLPPGRLDGNFIALLKLYPAATVSNTSTNNYYQSVNSSETLNQYDVRIDQAFKKDTLFGVFSRSSEVTTEPGFLPEPADGQNDGSGTNPSPHWAIAIGENHVFSGTLMNDAHFGLDHDIDNDIPSLATTLGLPAQYGIQGVPQTTGNGGLPAMEIGGLTDLGYAPYVPTYRQIITMELADNVTKIHGRQNIKTGWLMDSIWGDITQPAYGKGDFTYSGQYTSVVNRSPGLTGIADGLLIPTASSVGGANDVGGLTDFAVSNYAATNDHRYYMGAYVQDDWKVTPALTFDLGIRWDFTTPYAETSGRQANLFGANGGNGPGGTFYIPNATCNTPRSTSFNTLMATDGITISCVPGLSTGAEQEKNFAPRVGFAYRALPNLVVRGGYGITYGALDNIGFATNIGVNYPFSYNTAFSAPDSESPIVLSTGQTATMENALSVINIDDTAALDAESLDILGRQYNFQTPYTQTFNFTVQYEIDRQDAIQAGYVGNMSTHLDVSNTHNSPSQAAPPGASLVSYLPWPDFAPNSYYETTNGMADYHSLQVVYTRQMAHGVSAVANWTYSKCMTDAAEMFTSFPTYATEPSPGAGVLEPNYRAAWLPRYGISPDYTLCPNDATHVVHATGIFQLPVGRGQPILGHANNLVENVVGGWQFNYIFTWETGNPFTVECTVETSAFFGCNANYVPGQVYTGAHTRAHWLNAAAFSNPAPLSGAATNFSFLGGNSGQARGPGYEDLDASLFKEFNIHETTRLEFRAEAFNLVNGVVFSAPGNLTFTDPATFGQISSQRNSPRILQFALKLYY